MSRDQTLAAESHAESHAQLVEGLRRDLTSALVEAATLKGKVCVCAAFYLHTMLHTYYLPTYPWQVSIPVCPFY